MAVKHNIEIEQGTTFTIGLTWTQDGVPVNLTGYTARMQMRENYDDANPQFSITSEAGEIVLGSDGTVQITVPASKTSAISAESGVYDVEVEDAQGVVIRLIQGSVKVSKEATK